jgi:LmbE family N-acetylglucosaminyl deacetylase
VRQLEYPIWLFEQGNRHHRPQPGEASALRLDIAAVVACKRAAIACHRSQLGGLIDDDPDGFALTPETLAHFTCPWEHYLEVPCRPNARP